MASGQLLPERHLVGWSIAVPARHKRDSGLAGLFRRDEGVDLDYELIEKGFQLACFVVGDRAAAIQILINAINKLETQCRSERKKNYWRDKYLKRRITRIALSECDTLQWLICFESDQFEQQQELAGQCTTDDMVLRYIKCLIRISSGMSCFYVNIGLNRLLYNYSTPELQKMYESVTEHYLGPDEYRRGKRVLLDHLQARFGKFLTTTRTEHGELRFVAADDQDSWNALAHNCLAALTPWSTAGNCPVPPNFDSLSHDLASSFSRNGDQKTDYNATETRRCHAFIDPACFARLSAGLHLGSPDTRLSIPRFNMKNDDKSKDKPARKPTFPPLTEQERIKVRKAAAAEAASRHHAFPKAIRVLVDGAEAARAELDRKRDITFEVAEGAKLIEIRTADEGQDLLLATHFLTYKDWRGLAASTAVIVIRGAGKVALTVSPRESAEPSAASHGGFVSLSFHPGAFRFLTRIGSGSSAQWLRPAPVISIAVVLLMAVGWMLSSVSMRRQLAHQREAAARLEIDLSREKAARASLEQNLQVGSSPARPTSFKLVPDVGVTRGEDNMPFPVVILPAQPGLINLQLPIEESGTRIYRAALTLFASTQEILVENLLRPVSTGARSVIEFSVPSNLLQNRRDYTVNLRQLRPRVEDIGGFSFHVK